MVSDESNHNVHFQLSEDSCSAGSACVGTKIVNFLKICVRTEHYEHPPSLNCSYTSMKKANSYQINLRGKAALSEDALRGVKGVASLKHDPQKGTLLVVIDERRVDDAAEILQEVVERIRQAGGEVRTEKATHPVLHMTCAAPAQARKIFSPSCPVC